MIIYSDDKKYKTTGIAANNLITKSPKLTHKSTCKNLDNHGHESNIVKGDDQMKKSNKEEVQDADKAKPLNNQNQSKTRKNTAGETPKEKYPSGCSPRTSWL